MLKLSEMFEDHAVLQRDMPIPVWGVCDHEGAQVRVSIAGQSAEGVVKNAQFRATLPALSAGGPYKLRAEAAGEIIQCEDVLVGEVWLAGGQSNMEMPLFAADGAKDWLEQQHFGDVRLKTISRRTYDTPIQYGFHFIPESTETVPWQCADFASAARFSAIGCVFGARLNEDLDVPVGIISCNLGATKVQPWVSPESIRRESCFAGDAEAFTALRNGLGEEARTSQERMERAMKACMDQRDEFVMRSLEDPLYFCHWDATNPWPPKGAIGDQNEPACLWRYMLSRVFPYAMRGVIWYQGESSANLKDTPRYQEQMHVMLRDWRRAFENDDLWLIQAQLAPYDTSRRADPCDWPAIREAQKRLCLDETHVAMANLSGLGQPRNIHPIYKIQAAERMISVAENSVYGFSDASVPPEALSARREGTKIRVTFTAGAGLHLADEPSQLETMDSQGQIHTASGICVENDSLVLDAQGAVAVRYGWYGMSEDALQNGAGLPVGPFCLRIGGD